MIKTEPNPLNFFDIRRLSCPPEHFEYLNIPIKYNLEDAVAKWIVDHLKNRFYLGKTVALVNDEIQPVIQIGFEDPKELSYFSLACPYLKYN